MARVLGGEGVTTTMGVYFIDVHLIHTTPSVQGKRQVFHYASNRHSWRMTRLALAALGR